MSYKPLDVAKTILSAFEDAPITELAAAYGSIIVLIARRQGVSPREAAFRAAEGIEDPQGMADAQAVIDEHSV